MAPTILSLLAISSIISTAIGAPLDERNIWGKIRNVCPLDEINGALPAPNIQPTIIALGVGTQNYTCDSTTGTFGSNVALASLYDIGNIVRSSTKDTLTRRYLSASQSCHRDHNPWNLKQIGEHFFDSAGIPNFDFTQSNGDWLQAKKVASAPAPVWACDGVGEDTNGAVDWLYLADNGKGVSKELKSVYRVETAGGKPPASCQGDEQYEVPYAAEYWFYTETFS